MELTKEDIKALKKLFPVLKKTWLAHQEYELKDMQKGEAIKNPPPPTIWELMSLIEVAAKPGTTVTELTAAKGIKASQSKMVDSLSGGRKGQKKASFYLEKRISGRNANARELYLTEGGKQYLKEIAETLKEVCHGDKED